MKKIILRLVPVLVGFIVLALLLTPWLVGFFAVANDDLLLRNTYDNPIIEGGYAGWREVSAAEGMTFMLPEEWTLTTEGTTLVITEAEGGVVARGFTNGSDFDQAAYDAVLAEMAGFPVMGTEYQPVPEFVYAHGCDMYRVVIQGEGQQAAVYQLSLDGNGQAVHLYFPNCHGAAFTALIDRAEAIAYSLLYGAAAE